MKTQRLFRPVGLGEFQLIQDAGFVAFPPRLDWQPIFYPVLNQTYARQIALEWNTKDAFSSYCGIVTGFDVPVSHLKKYPVRVVGGSIHEELWVPAQELPAFNAAIVGQIEVLEIHLSPQFNPKLLDEFKNHSEVIHSTNGINGST